jgi:hypothetical protein
MFHIKLLSYPHLIKELLFNTLLSILTTINNHNEYIQKYNY